MSESLNQAADRVLIENLPPGLKAAIDRLLARGASRTGVGAAVAAFAAKAAAGDQNKGKLIVAAAEAYLRCR